MRSKLMKVMIAACVASAVAAPAASAGITLPVVTTTESVETCTDPAVDSLLSAFGDLRSYFAAPGGDFENGAAGWQLTGGAAIVPGSSSLGVLGGSSSLQLAAGSSAISPAFCVDERYPSFRMASAQLGDAKVKVKVEVVTPGVKDNVDQAGSLATKSATDWGLSSDMKIDTKKPGWHRVALRLSVDKAATWSDLRVDDVVVDPRMR